MNYRSDHIRLLKVFAAALPKKTSFAVEDLAKAFSDVKKRKPDTALDADRACRNALRKPRAMGHVENADRGEYRLTAAGVAFCKKLEGYEVAPDKAKGEKKAKAPKKAKEAKAKASTKASAKAPVKAAAKAPAKVAAKAPAKAKEAKEPIAAKAENTKPRKRLIPGLKPKEDKVEAAADAPVESAPKSEVPADLAL